MPKYKIEILATSMREEEITVEADSPQSAADIARRQFCANTDREWDEVTYDQVELVVEPAIEALKEGSK